MRPLGVKVKSIRRVGFEDVYCLASGRNGTMIVNGIITRQCDALRYVVASFIKGKKNLQIPSQTDVYRMQEEQRKGHWLGGR